jgi:hypothetical protein
MKRRREMNLQANTFPLFLAYTELPDAQSSIRGGARRRDGASMAIAAEKMS